jgi:hypothetical protein
VSKSRRITKESYPALKMPFDDLMRRVMKVKPERKTATKRRKK